MTSTPGVHEGTFAYAIDIVGVTKRFERKTLRSGYTTLKAALLGLFRRRDADAGPTITHAIRDLTLRIPLGSSVGVIGRNGSGKSTFLKLITGIYKPTAGRIAVNGRVAALIELGAGFHPDFSGRENLFLGGIMHGLTRSQIADRFDEIVRFAELEGVIDDPVRTYSSGMFMRLGFSLAVHTDPDILLIDEVLAVGDAGFVAKCKDRIAELRRSGKTLLLVTHDLGAVERWCDEVLWLHEGEVRERGEPRRVIDAYRQFLEGREEDELRAGQAVPEVVPAPESAPQRWGSREVEITGVRLVGRDSVDHLVFHTADPVRIEIDYEVREQVPTPVFGIGLHRADGLAVFGTNTDLERVVVPPLGTVGTVECAIDRLGLLEGAYTLDVAVHREDGYPYDYHRHAIRFSVRSGAAQVGVFEPPHTWHFPASAVRLVSGRDA